MSQSLRLLLVFCVVYAWFLARNSEPVPAGADCGGYLGSAKLLSEGKLKGQIRTIPEFRPADPRPYTPHGYIGKGSSGVMVPSYPVGLPLHFALSSKLLGWYWGPLLVQVLGAVSCVVLCYSLLRELKIDPDFAAIGALVLAVSPLLLSVTFIPLSDAWAAAWCTAAVVAALRARRSWKWALAAGVAVSMAMLVRPNSLLVLPALALILFRWKLLLAAVLGGLPLSLLSALYNQALYGGPLQTGYGGIGGALAAHYVAGSFLNYLRTFCFVLPVVFPAALLIPWLSLRKNSREIGALWLWLGAFLVFFSFYLFTPTHWWYLRFVLPAFPGAVALGMVALDRLALAAAERQLPFSRGALGAAIVAISVATSVYWTMQKRITHSAADQSTCTEVSLWARQHLPAAALVGSSYSSSALYFYTEYPIVRWDCLSPEIYRQLVSAISASGRPFYAVLTPAEEETTAELLSAKWKKVTSLRGFNVWEYQNLGQAAPLSHLAFPSR